MPRAIIIDFDHTIFNGHSHNLINDLFVRVYLPWRDALDKEMLKLKDASEQAYKNASIQGPYQPQWQERLVLIQKQILEAQLPTEKRALDQTIARLNLPLELRWAIKVFWLGMPKPGVEDPSFDQRCLTYLCSRPEYASVDEDSRNAAMQISSATHQWKEVIEKLVSTGDKVAIASFGMYPSLLKLFLQKILKIDPQVIAQIEVVAWLPENAATENKNHHIQQALLLMNFAGAPSDVILVDDSDQNCAGAKALEYSALMASYDGQHLDRLFELPVFTQAASSSASVVSSATSFDPQTVSNEISALGKNFRELEKKVSELNLQVSQQCSLSFQETLQLTQEVDRAIAELEKTLLVLARAVGDFAFGGVLARELIQKCQKLQEMKRSVHAVGEALERRSAASVRQHPSALFLSAQSVVTAQLGAAAASQQAVADDARAATLSPSSS